MSITFGSEKAWRWQCAHQELRQSYSADGGEMFRQRQRDTKARYGVLQRRFQRLQQKQMAQVMLRWMVGCKFRAWRDWACGLARRRRMLRQVGGRLAHRTVARAFAVRSCLCTHHSTRLLVHPSLWMIVPLHFLCCSDGWSERLANAGDTMS